MVQTHEDYDRQHAVERSSDRSFGLLFSAVCFFFALKGHNVRLGAAGACLLLVTLLAPRLLSPFNILWFKFGLLLSKITTPIVLLVLYYGVFTPLALWMRLTGKDLLKLRTDPSVASYWIHRTPPSPDPQTLKQQF